MQDSRVFARHVLAHEKLSRRICPLLSLPWKEARASCIKWLTIGTGQAADCLFLRYGAEFAVEEFERFGVERHEFGLV